MGLGPVEALRQALARAGVSIKDIDLYEINEALAARVLPSADDLGMDLDRLDVDGARAWPGSTSGSPDRTRATGAWPGTGQAPVARVRWGFRRSGGAAARGVPRGPVCRPRRRPRCTPAAGAAGCPAPGPAAPGGVAPPRRRSRRPAPAPGHAPSRTRRARGPRAAPATCGSRARARSGPRPTGDRSRYPRVLAPAISRGSDR
nr:hypothetical protein [Arsenicicoccus dermatophilus]